MKHIAKSRIENTFIALGLPDAFLDLIHLPVNNRGNEVDKIDIIK